MRRASRLMPAFPTCQSLISLSGDGQILLLIKRLRGAVKNAVLKNYMEGKDIVHGLIREESSFGPNPRIKDLARHLYTRMYFSPVVVIVDNPSLAIIRLRKQWAKLVRKVQQEQLAANDASRLVELSHAISHMQNLQFSLEYPPDEYEGDIFVVSEQKALTSPLACRTVYICEEVSNERIYMLTAWMPPGSLVVLCRLSF
jgi:hypothetical protein